MQKRKQGIYAKYIKRLLDTAGSLNNSVLSKRRFLGITVLRPTHLTDRSLLCCFRFRNCLKTSKKQTTLQTAPDAKKFG